MVSSLKSLEHGVNVGGVQSLCVVPAFPYQRYNSIDVKYLILYAKKNESGL